MAPDYQVLGQRMKDRREELSMTLGDVADIVGVSPSTIMRYERGAFAKVKLPIVEAIASALQVDPSWLVGLSNNKERYITNNKKSATPLTDEALEIAAKYDKATPIIKNVVKTVLSISKDGSVDQALFENQRTKTIPLFGARFAAGAPETPGDMEWENFETTNMRAEFAIHVNGDSMEPYLTDGSIVFGIRRFPDNGEVGAFRLDGEFLVKQFMKDSQGNTYLFSANRIRDDADQFLPYGGDRDLTCYGTILCAKIPLPQ